jgi:glycosyltransferase involved in cell wall biosynthesis
MPTFGRLHFLRQAVDSVFAQSYPSWELVIVDDGSDATTLAYLNQIATHPAVRLIARPHCGRPSMVRNVGLNVTRGSYVAFLDSDDVWMREKLELQLAALRARPGCRWCYTAFARVTADGNILEEEARRPWRPLQGSIFAAVISAQATIRTPGVVLVERALLLEAGGFDEHMRNVEDFDLWSRLALRSDIALVDKVLVHVRQHDQNFSSSAESPYDWRDYSISKLSAVAGSDWQSLLKRERSRSAVVHASAAARQGERREATRILIHSARYSWFRGSWWWGVMRLAAWTLLRAPAGAGGRSR